MFPFIRAIKKKLTHTVEAEVIKFAKRLAKRHGKSVILHALKSSFKDKEDAHQYFTAQQNEADYFITRNIRDYKPYVEFLSVMTAKTFNDSIGSEE